MSLASKVTGLNYKVSMIDFNFGGTKFEVMVLDENADISKGEENEIEQKRFVTEKEAKKFYNRMVKKYSITDEMQGIENSCINAQAEANKHVNHDDGGACNFDSVNIRIARNKTFADKFNRFGKFKIEKIAYGIYKGAYRVNFQLKGQAQRRTKMAGVCRNHLTLDGYKSAVEYVMD